MCPVSSRIKAEGGAGRHVIEDLLALIRARLPLRVSRISADADPSVVLLGDIWSLALNCPWTLFDCTFLYRYPPFLIRR